MKNLRDLGNTVIVVEHDEDTMKIADYIVDIGKYAGVKIKEGEFNAYKDPNDPRNKTIRSKIKLVFDDYSQDNIFDIEIAKSN